MLTALIELVEVQLAEMWAQVRDQNTYMLGFAGLGFAGIGIVAAAQSVLGKHWWVPIPGLFVTSVFALLSTRVATSNLGPRAPDFYDAFEATPPAEALGHLLADLNHVLWTAPRATIERQRLLFYVSIVLLAITAAYSIPLMV
jgi:hypothetical protein